MSEMYGRRLPYLLSWPLLIGTFSTLYLPGKLSFSTLLSSTTIPCSEIYSLTLEQYSQLLSETTLLVFYSYSLLSPLSSIYHVTTTNKFSKELIFFLVINAASYLRHDRTKRVRQQLDGHNRLPVPCWLLRSLCIEQVRSQQNPEFL